MIEGQYAIPVDFKAFVKWEEDEICMMTRQMDEAIEYQFLYLPKSSSVDNLTLLPWSEDAHTAWSHMREMVRTLEDRDLSFFDSDPWCTFGITNKTVQSRIRADKSTTVVTGILRCSPENSNESSRDQFREYLKFTPQDAGYEWIIDAIMQEAIPHYFSRHVSEGSVYWVDGRTGLSTWAHPLYDKYSSMLKKARELRPLSDAKSMIEFQLKCLAPQPEESLENMHEIARILGIKLKEEPFLVPVVRGLLGHVRLVSSFVSLQTVDDVKYLIAQKRSEFASLERTVALQSAKTACVECEKERASIHCSDCGDLFCGACFECIHSSGSRKYSHKRTEIERFECCDCAGSAVATFFCPNCKDHYCEICFEQMHSRGGRRNHVSVIVKTGSTLVPQESLNRRRVDKMKSVWIRLCDAAGTAYCNLETLESRRDLPLALVND